MLPLHWLSLVKTCPLQGGSLSLPRTLMIMMAMTMTTSSLKIWRVVDICKDALGYQTPQMPPQSHSSDILPSPSKGPPGQPYRGRGESVGPWSRTKILTTIISTPHGPAPGEGNGTLLQYSCLENPMDGGAWWAAVHGVAESWTRLSDFTFTFHFHALEKETATHSSVLAWRIPGMGEPGGLQSMGSHRVRHN